MPYIDSFINVPLILIAGIAVLLFIFLLFIRIKKTAKVSFIFFFMSAIIALGAVYCLFNKQYFYLAVTIIIAQVLLLPYLILKAFDNPQKREEKRASKKQTEINVSHDSDMVNKEVVAQIEEKYKRLLNINKDLIFKLSTFFSSNNSLENFLEYCNNLVTEKVKADGCIFIIADDYDNTLSVKSFKGNFPPPYKLPEDLPHKPIRVETNLKFAQFPLTDNIFGQIFTDGQPVLIEDSVKDSRVFQNGPEEFLKCGSYIFVQLKQFDTVIGLIALSRNYGNEKFTKADFDSAIILADAISTSMKPLYSFLDYAEHTELHKGGSIASKYQKDMLPQKFPVIPGLSIGCFTNQMENVCGDYYDILVSRKDKISFVMADVAGKGMNSLIVMIMIRAVLRLAVHTAQSASTVMSWVNRGICLENSKIDHFASVALIDYNPLTKEADICTCGNNPVFHYCASDKTVKQISIPSEPMGVTKDTVYKSDTINLSPGDIIVTCTDGLLESLNVNGVQYSLENLKIVIIKNSNASAKDISNRVKDNLKRYCGTAQQYDDQSLLIVKVQ